MVNVDIDYSLYEEVKLIVKENKLRYPSVRFFVQKGIMNEIEKNEDKTSSKQE